MSSIYEEIVFLSEDIIQGRLKASEGEIVTRLTGIAVRVDDADTKVMVEIHRLKRINPVSTLNKGVIDKVIDKLNDTREELY